jgi:hypothetical protein
MFIRTLFFLSFADDETRGGFVPLSFRFLCFFFGSFCGKQVLITTFFFIPYKWWWKRRRTHKSTVGFLKNLCHVVCGKQVFITMLLFEPFHMMTRRRRRFMPPPLGIGFLFVILLQITFVQSFFVSWSLCLW